MKRLFEEQCAKTPSQVALQCGSEALSFTQLNQRANFVCSQIKQKVGTSTAPVGISCVRSFDSVIALLAVLKAGLPYVPIDPEYPENRRDFMIQDSNVQVILTNHPEKSPLGRRTLLKALSLESFTRPKPPSTVSHLPIAPQEFPENPPDVETDRLCVLYTSGSTGRPKGVLVNQHATLNRFEWMWEKYPFTADDICSHRTSLNFVDSLWEIFGPLLKGVKLVIIPFTANGDIHTTVSILSENRVTRFTTVPILLESILMTFPNLAEALPHLHLWIVSGETLTSNLVTSFLAAGSKGILLNLYGSTEVAGDVTYHEITKDCAGMQTTLLTLGDPVPIGRPITNANCYVYDENMNPVPPGETGELYVGGPVLASGYHNDPEQSNARFKETEHGVLFKTGDLVYQNSEGLFYFVTRTGNRIKIRGMQVELDEVKHTLERFSPNVNAVVVSYQNRFASMHYREQHHRRNINRLF